MKKRVLMSDLWEQEIFEEDEPEEDHFHKELNLAEEMDVAAKILPPALTRARLKDLEEQLDQEKAKGLESEKKVNQSFNVVLWIDNIFSDVKELKESFAKSSSTFSVRDFFMEPGKGMKFEETTEETLKMLEAKIEEAVDMLKHYFRQSKKFIPNKIIIIPEKFSNKEQEESLPWSLLRAGAQEHEFVASLVEKLEKKQTSIEDIKKKLTSVMKEGLSTGIQRVTDAVMEVGIEVARCIESRQHENEVKMHEKKKIARRARNRLRLFYRKEYSVMLVSSICFNIIQLRIWMDDVKEGREKLRLQSTSMTQAIDFVKEFHPKLVTIAQNEKEILTNLKTKFIDFFFKVNQKFFHVGGHPKFDEATFKGRTTFFALTKHEKDILHSLHNDGLLITQNIENALGLFEHELKEFLDKVNGHGFLIEAVFMGLQDSYKECIAIEEIYKKTCKLFSHMKLYESLEQMKILQKKLLFYKQCTSQREKKLLGIEEHDKTNLVGDLEDYVEYLKSKSTSSFMTPVINFFEGFLDYFYEKEIEENE